MLIAFFFFSISLIVKLWQSYHTLGVASQWLVYLQQLFSSCPLGNNHAFIQLKLNMYTTFFPFYRKQLFEKPHNFVHLNLAIALFLAFLVFVAGIESAKHNEVHCM